MDAYAAAIWYLVTVTVLRLAWSVARRLFPGDRSASMTMHSLVLAWTWVVAGSCLLGTFGGLDAADLAGVVLLLAGTTWYLIRRYSSALLPELRYGSQESPAGVPPSSPSLVIIEGGNRLGTFCDRQAQGEVASRVRHDGQPRSLGDQTAFVIWTTMATMAVGLIVTQGVGRFPGDWDTLMYHLPLVDLWIQTGSLYVPECAVWHAPGNNELLGVWWAVPFSGDFWVGLINVPAGLLLAVGTFELAGRLGIGRLLQHGCAIAVTGNFVALLQLTNAKNDLAVAGLLAAGLTYGVRVLQGGGMRALMFAGASLGLLAGVKYYALGYAAAAWLSLAAVWILHRGRRGGLLSVTLAFVMLLPSGYWYARNAWNTGTPLYPLGYSGPNLVEVESRLRGSVWESSLLGNGQIELLKRYVDAVWIDGGTCQTVAVLLLPFTILWLLSSGAHAVRPGPAGIETRVLRVGVVVATVSAWLIFAVTPFTVDPENGWLLRSSVLAVRFSLVPLTLSILALTLVLFDVQRWMENRRWRYPARQLSGLLAASFAVIALFGFCRAAVRHFDGEWMSLLISFDVALGLLFAGRLRLPAPVRQRTSLRAGFGLACGAGIAAATSLFLSQRWHDGFARHYDARFGTDAFSFLQGQEHPLPSIAALPFRYYPFFGSRRQFHVHRPLRVMSLRYLYKYIAANDIDLIAVVTRAGSHPETITSRRLLNWMKEQTGAFEKIMSGALFDVYRVDHGCLADGADAVSTGHIDRKRGDQLDSELNLRLHP